MYSDLLKETDLRPNRFFEHHIFTAPRHFISVVTFVPIRNVRILPGKIIAWF